MIKKKSPKIINDRSLDITTDQLSPPLKIIKDSLIFKNYFLVDNTFNERYQ